MKFRVLEPSFINETLHEEGAVVAIKNLRDEAGNPLMRICGNLEPVDDEAKAFAAEADAFFAHTPVGTARSVEGDAVSAKINEVLAPLMQAMQAGQTSKA